METLLLIAALLFGAPANPGAPDIFDAARRNDLGTVRSLIDANPQLLQARDSSGRSPLHAACEGGDLDLLALLVARGAPVDAKDDDGITPLHRLAAKAHSRGISLLLANGADVNAASGLKDTPLHYAAQSGTVEVVRLLLAHGADPKARNNMRTTPLLYAIQGNSLDTAECLMSSGGDVDPSLLDVYHSITPLVRAISVGNVAMVRMLHRKGADIRYRTPYGESYLHHAAAANSVDIAEYLIASGIPVDSVKAGGLTPLHIAAVLGRTDMTRYLVGRGARLDVRAEDGATPLHMAVASRQHEVAGLLRCSGAAESPRAFPVYRGKYLGQKVPGTEPEPFVPGLFRDIYRAYSTPVFSPDGRELFWCSSFMVPMGSNRIWWMRQENGRWTPPEQAPFSDFDSWHPAMSPDGKRLYFASNRPRAGQTGTETDLWCSDKLTDGTWSQARHLGSPPNTDGLSDMYPVPARDGTVYFKVYGPGTRGTHMFRSRLVNGGYEPPVSLDDIIDAGSRHDRADIDHVIVYTFGGPNGAELSIAFHRHDGRWTRPVYMGNVVHRRQGTPDGKLSPDGKYFFFVQNVTPYWIEASFMNSLRRNALRDEVAPRK